MLVKLQEVVYDSLADTYSFRDTFLKKESIVMLTDDNAMTRKINETLGKNTPVSRVAIDLAGSVKEIVVVGTAKLIRSRLDVVITPTGRSILHD